MLTIVFELGQVLVLARGDEVAEAHDVHRPDASMRVGREPWTHGRIRRDEDATIESARGGRRRARRARADRADRRRRPAPARSSSASSPTACAIPTSGRSSTATGARRSRCCSATRAAGIVEAVGRRRRRTSRPATPCCSPGRCPAGRAPRAVRGRPRRCAHAWEQPPRLHTLPTGAADRDTVDRRRSRPTPWCMRRRSSPCPRTSSSTPRACSVAAPPPGVGAAVNTARVPPGDTVAVIGLGGIGLSALPGAHGSPGPTRIDRDRSRGRQARDRARPSAPPTWSTPPSTTRSRRFAPSPTTRRRRRVRGDRERGRRRAGGRDARTRRHRRRDRGAGARQHGHARLGRTPRSAPRTRTRRPSQITDGGDPLADDFDGVARCARRRPARPSDRS